MNLDAFYLNRALQLARLGGVGVQPNPMVGAVIVHNNQIIGEGFHQIPGGPHAEVNAVNAVEDHSLLPFSTLYVTLEPCVHTGKTPPCTDLIIRHKIPKVVLGCTDPNPKVSGKGIERLRSQGVEVVMADDPTPFTALNKIFFTNQEKQRPYICLKWAQSGDGFIAGHSEDDAAIRTGISGPESQRIVHKLRATYQGILIGSRTAIVDDPSLNTRYYPGKSPIRLVWNTSSQPLPSTLKLFQTPPDTFVLERQIYSSHSILIDNHSPKSVIQAIFETGISSVLIEGGRNTLQSFLDAGLFDEIYRFRNPNMCLVKGVPAPIIPNEAWRKESIVVGQDWLEIFQQPE
ncbi:MAG: bifunctional diaminohydroxyphosphoribosylaminopyrimidine deaminase/5-amino-6-(5-phosphoribosylamino)uracil reductase RibD [Bacteroidia bacterium]|nr:bifunctional diaminohydroxyphosphoribosylaminopyrimidine deaminase/5-amino-6-(5-phosphoribosylamino)uracil reductase RibD [Bacteroidia bacterium]